MLRTPDRKVAPRATRNLLATRSLFRLWHVRMHLLAKPSLFGAKLTCRDVGPLTAPVANHLPRPDHSSLSTEIDATSYKGSCSSLRCAVSAQQLQAARKRFYPLLGSGKAEPFDRFDRKIARGELRLIGAEIM